MLKSFKLQLFFLLLHIYGRCLATNLSSINPRIKGGTDAKKEDIYCLVSICDATLKPCQHFCEGSLITARAVVSLGGCVIANVPPEKYGLKMGSLRLRETTSDTLFFNVAKFIPHENYNKNTLENNIAIFLANGSVPDNHFVRPIKLPEYEAKPKSSCQVLGWGSGFSSSEIAKKLTVRLQSKGECVDRLPNFRAGLLCAENEFGEEVVLVLELGGPLICNEKLIGISGSVLSSTDPNPAMYVDVFHYKEWILKNSSKRNTLSIFYIILITVILKFTM